MIRSRNGQGDDLRVIALIASAGGLEAVSQVLERLPPDLNASVIVLIHQAPDRENALVRLLGRRSRLPVQAAQDKASLQASSVIVTPPGKHVLIVPGPTVALLVSGVTPPSRPSADLLLTTLATACGPRAIAVILSGGGHDGATGATAIHDFGGTVLASDHASTEHFSMAQATIERGSVVDHVVALDEIADLLAAIVAAPKL
jgi:two-component system chemotaxis response regulator CheB